jgi:DNA-directed RNA polymerase beta' subunit
MLTNCETERIFDPVHNKHHDDIQVGENYWLKMRHQVRKKMSARSHEGPYTIDERPSRGGGESAQSVGPLEIVSMLAGGHTKFLNDVAGIKSNKNTDYWANFQMGLPTPRPKTPHVLEKFETYLKGAGINLSRHDNTIKASPFHDDDILKLSRGVIKSPNVLRATKDGLAPERGGLFDKGITGGFDSEHWNHIELPERMIHPMYEAPVQAITGLAKKDFDAFLAGKKFHNGKTGGEALADMLGEIKVKPALREAQEQLKTAKKTERDKLLKKIRYLGGLDKVGLDPVKAYTNKYVPVIPTKFRPVYDLPDGSLNVADPNHGYREMLFISKELENLKKKGVSDEHLAPLRAGLYGAYSGLVGLTEPLTRGGNFKGFISNIAGAQNKTGLFQARVVSRRQDLSGRSTIITAPHLGMDEIGIPEEMGRQIYKPYLVRELVTGSGLKPIDARKEVEEGSERVGSLLNHVMKDRPVMINRAPSLHKFSTIALRPHAVPGRAIHLNNLVFAGLNADAPQRA